MVNALAGGILYFHGIQGHLQKQDHLLAMANDESTAGYDSKFMDIHYLADQTLSLALFMINFMADKLFDLYGYTCMKTLKLEKTKEALVLSAVSD